MEDPNQTEKTEEKPPEKQEEKGIIPQLIEEEMKNSYLAYAMSVIVGRALPDVRDGLKPVHRRILYAMNDMGMYHNKPFKKSARIVGECLGKYHPHGDSAVYDSLVRMAQDFSLRYPLIFGQGNFGSIDGDSAAAMRYCVTGDTLVLTEKGITPIEKISSKKEDKINLNTLNYQGKENKASKFFNSGKHKIIKITTKEGYKIKGSYNHPLLCWTVNEFSIPTLKWKLLEEITTKDYVMMNRNHSLFSKKNPNLKEFWPKTKDREKNISLPKEMNKELAFLLGALVSEGSFHQKKIIFNNKDQVFYNKVKNSILKNFLETTLYERNIKGNCKELDLYHQKVVRFLINIGLKHVKSDLKEIPQIILKSKKVIIKEFLRALFEGDGSIRALTDKRHNGKSMQLYYDSKSKKLIYQLKTILLNFGIITTNPYIDKRSNCYRLIIPGVENINKFRKEINFFSERKKNTLNLVKKINKNRMSKIDHIPFLNNYLRKNYDNSFIKRHNFDRYNNLEKNYNKLIRIIKPSDKKIVDWLLKHKYFFNKVKTVKKSTKKETVYSIKVKSDCHSFVANGFINHNTEAKLRKIAEEMLADIDKETVNFTDNFDGSLKEPTVLPSRIPNLLINGSSGIAVGMATNIPPHNLNEVCTAITQVIDNPEIETKELFQTVKGPDFPTAGIIQGNSGIEHAYTMGRGRAIVRARTTTEEHKSKQRIIVKEIPYMVNKSLMIEQIADCVKNKNIQGISDIRDESDREGMRIVIELKKEANPDIVLNQLHKYSRMQTTFGINMLALVNNEPKVLNLKEMLELFIKHRKEVITRRTEYDLKKAKERSHILEGLIIALNNVDDVVKTIKESRSVEFARNSLMTKYELSEIQAKSILEMRLQKLTSLEQNKIRDEHKELQIKIKDFEDILANEVRVYKIIKNDMQEIMKNYGNERRTQIVPGTIEGDDIDIGDLIKPEDMVVTITHKGYIKRLPIDTYKQQRRGGKGIIATGTKEEDFVEHLFVANTHDWVLFFTEKGTVHWLKVYQLPEGSRQSQGKAIVNLLNIPPKEKITAFIPIKKFKEKEYLLMATKNGIIKKTSSSAYSKPRQGGIKAINLDQDDKLVNVILTNGKKQIILASKNGMAVKFKEKDARPIGRTSRGVRGITLKGKDELIGMVEADETRTLLTITKNGYGKRTRINDYRLINRGGKGVINIQCSERNGGVVAVKSVGDFDEIMFISMNGIIIRTPCKGISIIGRNTQGMRLMRLKSSSDRVVAAARIISDGEETDLEKEAIQENPLEKEQPTSETPKEEPENPSEPTKDQNQE